MILKIKLSKDNKKKLLEKSKDLAFNNLEEYIHFILDEIIENPPEVEEDDQEKEVMEKLKDLGYL